MAIAVSQLFNSAIAAKNKMKTMGMTGYNKTLFRKTGGRLNASIVVISFSLEGFHLPGEILSPLICFFSFLASSSSLFFSILLQYQ